MSLVLEHEDPVLELTVNIDLDLNGAGIDLLALIEIGHKTVGFELLCSDSTEIHEGDRLVSPAELLADIDIHFVCILDIRSGNIDIFNIGKERGMAAVIRPIGIYHSDLCDSGVALFGIAEIVLTEFDVIEIHSETELFDKGVEPCIIEVYEALKLLDRCWDVVICIEGLNGFERSLAALYGVDDISLKLSELFIGECA